MVQHNTRVDNRLDHKYYIRLKRLARVKFNSLFVRKEKSIIPFDTCGQFNKPFFVVKSPKNGLKVYVVFKHFHPGRIFTSKAGTYLNGAAYSLTSKYLRQLSSSTLALLN